MTNPITVYDVGANQGDNLPYYFHKADRVVAIEANPQLCELIATRFESHIRCGRLFVECCAVGASEGVRQSDFYIHRHNHVLSQLDPPDTALASQYQRVSVPVRSIVELISHHGSPHYVKIDIEHRDAQLLRSMFQCGIRPTYISAECHRFEVLSVLYEFGRYRAFKVVDGESVGSTSIGCSIRTLSGTKLDGWSFPIHSAGPFGDDVPGEWGGVEHVCRLLGLAGFGWRDIHASAVDQPSSTSPFDLERNLHHLEGQVRSIALLRHVSMRAKRSLLRRVWEPGD